MEDRNIITIGWHKGEIDFGVNCSIDQLTREEMRDLREMVCVAIGQAESMWRNSLDKKHPATEVTPTQP